MSSRDSAAHDGHDHRGAAVDLSTVFGAAAAALSRRRTRRSRPKQVREPEPADPETMEDDVPDPTRRPRRPNTPGPRRRFGVVRVRDRQHVDLLLLAAATDGPANGPELIDLVRERSDGLFVLPLRVVVRELHRLANDRLVEVTGGGRVHRYSLTALGERVLASRRREWEAFSHGLDAVLDAGNGRRP